MKCANCGKSIDNDSEYCIYCGNRVTGIKKLNSNYSKDKKTQNHKKEHVEAIKESKRENNKNKYNLGEKSKKYGQNSLQKQKYKLLTIIFIAVSLLLIISTVLTSVLLFNKNKQIKLINEEYNSLEADYISLKDTKNSLEREYNDLKEKYNVLLKESEYFPEKPEDYIELTGKIEESYEAIVGQITYIHFLKMGNSFTKYIDNLVSYYENLDKELNKLDNTYWNNIIELEQKTWKKYLELERNLNNGLISYATYSNQWDANLNNYDSEYRKINKEHNNEYNKIISKYETQIENDYDEHVKELDSADKELNERLDYIYNEIKEIYKKYGIEMPEYGWLEERDLEIFGLDELYDRYEKEIEELYYLED